MPFFINTTYKSYLSEFAPIAKMIDNVRKVDTKANYYSVMDLIVANHKDDFDYLVGLEGPDGYVWKTKEYEKDEIRQLALIQLTKYQITFTVNLKKSVTLYAICGL